MKKKPIVCSRCKKTIDTLAKRRHRCSQKLYGSVAHAREIEQMVLDHDHLPPHLRLQNRMYLETDD